MNTISPLELHDVANSQGPVDLLDVRTPAEFRELHVPFARNVPLDQLDPVAESRARNNSGNPLYVICRSGSRATIASQKLTAAGCANVVIVEGGTQGWERAGLPVVRGRKSISLERQVRIAAGSLVLIGVTLGTLVSPYWLALAAFVGAGLLFSGVTDTCGMAMLLSRMPWNQ